MPTVITIAIIGTILILSGILAFMYDHKLCKNRWKKPRPTFVGLVLSYMSVIALVGWACISIPVGLCLWIDVLNIVWFK